MIEISLSEKQLIALELLDDPQLTELTFGGGAGGGKTMLVCIWIVLQCRKYPGIRVGLGRKELTRLKQTTLTSLLREAHQVCGVTESEFTYQDQKHLVQYVNGSQVQLFDLVRQPSDPDFDTLGSLNLTHTVIEEAGEVVKKARDVFGSRRNRFLNKQYNLVGKMICTLNPTQNFMRDEFYEPYVKAGGGEWQKWEHGDVYVGEEKKTAYRAFVRSLVTDNPFAPRNYIEVLKQLPPAERKRLLEGNWDYADEDRMLFKSLMIDRSMISELSEGSKYLGVDVAREGKDRTVLAMIEDNIVSDIHMPEIDTQGETAISEQTAFEVIKYAQQNNITAREISIDAIGVGAGVVDILRSRGWFVKEYKAGSGSSQDTYQNKRTESLWEMSQALEKGELKIYSQIPFKDQLRKELMAHEYDIVDRVIKVEPKDKIKTRIGYSPDIADAVVIAYDAANGQSDKRYNISRIAY